MTTEAGDKKLLGNLSELISLISAEPNYNPANPKLSKTALAALLASGEASVLGVAASGASNKLAITDCQVSYDELTPTALSSRDYLKASGAPTGISDDGQTYITKVIGSRKSKKIKDDPATPEDESKGSHSASQMSRENRLGNFEAYLEILKQVPSYNPNEANLKLTALLAFAADLKLKSAAVNTTAATLSQARGVRDQLLYLADDSIVNTAKLVKVYVKAVFGANSQIYKQIKGIPFPNPNR